MTTYKMTPGEEKKGREKNKATAVAATVPTSAGVRTVSTLVGSGTVKSDLESSAIKINKIIGVILEGAAQNKNKQPIVGTQSSQPVAPIARRGR